MSLGTPSARESEGMFRLVADSLPLLVWISGPTSAAPTSTSPGSTSPGDPSSPRSAMAGQTVYTPRICSIAWARTLAPSTFVNRS